MVRKMAYVGTSYLIGLFFASFLNFKLDFIIALGLVVIGVAYIFLINKKNLAVPVCIITISVALSIYGAYEALVYYPTLKYNGQVSTVQGEIIDIQYLSDDKAGYTIKGKLGKQSGYFGLYGEMLDCDYFDEITATGTMSKFENTYTFPAESYNKAKSSFLQMTEPSNISIKSHFSVRREILHYRDYLYNKIVEILPNDEGKALVAMLCGDKTGLDNDTKTVLFRSGIGHIMSVSGAHLAIVAALIISIIKNFKLGKWIEFGILEILIISFVIFAGMSDSVIRSALMVSIVYGANLFKRRADTFNSLGISIIILTALEPFVVRDASFILSIVGVLGIGVFAPAVTSMIKIVGIKGRVIKSFVAMMCVTIVVFPISFMFFDEISIISPITNVILIPICSLALVFGVIIALTGGVSFIAFPLLLMAGICCKLVLAVSRFIGALSFTYIPTGYVFVEICIIISIIGVVLSYIIFRKKKAILCTITASVIALTFCSLSFKIINMDTLSIAVLGDETSSSVIIHKDNSACIIDLNGGRKLANAEQKYLRKIGIKDIKVLALNSDVQQSISAYEKRFQLFDVGEVLVPKDEYLLNGTKVLGVSPTIINTDSTKIDMGSYCIFIEKDNTIKISYGKFSMLCVSGETLVDHSNEAYSAVAFYKGNTISIKAGYMITLNDKANINNAVIGSTLVTCKEDGQAKVRRITNGSRQ